MNAGALLALSLIVQSGTTVHKMAPLAIRVRLHSSVKPLQNFLRHPGMCLLGDSRRGDSHEGG